MKSRHRSQGDQAYDCIREGKKRTPALQGCVRARVRNLPVVVDKTIAEIIMIGTMAAILATKEREAELPGLNWTVRVCRALPSSDLWKQW